MALCCSIFEYLKLIATLKLEVCPGHSIAMHIQLGFQEFCFGEAHTCMHMAIFILGGEDSPVHTCMHPSMQMIPWYHRFLLLYLQIGACPSDYRDWLTTMYCQFGNKWSNLHLGPMWSIATVEHEGSTGRAGICSTTKVMLHASFL